MREITQTQFDTLILQAQDDNTRLLLEALRLQTGALYEIYEELKLELHTLKTAIDEVHEKVSDVETAVMIHSGD